MKTKIAMNKKTTYHSSDIETKTTNSAEIDDFRILSQKIWIQIGSLTAMTLIFTLSVVITTAVLLLRKFFDFHVWVLWALIYIGIMWCSFSILIVLRSFKAWDRYCDEFAKTLTEEYNKSVNSKLLLPIIGRHELQKAAYRAAVVYYFGFVGILLILVFGYILGYKGTF